MKGRKAWEIGGFAAGALLIVFGIGALYLGVTSYQLVHDELAREKIVGGQDMSPEAIQAGIEEGRPRGRRGPRLRRRRRVLAFAVFRRAAESRAAAS